MWALILHGGATKIAKKEADAYRTGCRRALDAGHAILARNGSAVDAVEAAIRALEDDPTFNCGYGSALNEDGEVEMCSAIMEGKSLNVGGVAVVQGVRHPISVAKAMLNDESILIAGTGARAYARKAGLELCSPEALKTPDQTEHSKSTGTHDTVGCLALDHTGLLVAGTSTGGLDGKPAGRVGDSPQPGCGYYAANDVGAVAFSGDGEHIARVMLAGRVIGKFDKGDPDAALKHGIDQVAAIHGEAGGIALTPDGKFGWMHNSTDFAVAYISSEMPEPHVFLNKKEERA